MSGLGCCGVSWAVEMSELDGYRGAMCVGDPSGRDNVRASAPEHPIDVPGGRTEVSPLAEYGQKVPATKGSSEAFLKDGGFGTIGVRDSSVYFI